MTSAPGPYQRVLFLEEALEDLRLLRERNPAALRKVFRLLKHLDAGIISPIGLRDFGKTGNLTDCGKIVVASDRPGDPEHRIVVRSIQDRFEVSEVVAVEDRTQDLPYLLAGLRLGRIHDPVRRSDAQRRVFRIRRALGHD